MSVPWCEFCGKWFSLDEYLEHTDVDDPKYPCIQAEEDGDLDEPPPHDAGEGVR